MKRYKPLTRTQLFVLFTAFTAVLALLFFPIGPPNCKGFDCFVIGPLARAGNPSGPATTTVTIIFPGTVNYADGSSASISASQNVMSILAGPKRTPVSSVNVQMQFLVNTYAPAQFGWTGYVDEDAFRSRSDVAGSYLAVKTIKTFSSSVAVAPPSTTVNVLNINRTASDLQGWGMSAGSNLTNPTDYHFNYALIGVLNFTFGPPINKTAVSIFSWPNLAITMPLSGSGGGGGGGGGSGGGGGCGTSQARCVSIANLPPGVKYSWYVLGFAVPSFQISASQSTNNDYLILIALLLF